MVVTKKREKSPNYVNHLLVTEDRKSLQLLVQGKKRLKWTKETENDNCIKSNQIKILEIAERAASGVCIYPQWLVISDIVIKLLHSSFCGGFCQHAS